MKAHRHDATSKPAKSARRAAFSRPLVVAFAVIFSLIGAYLLIQGLAKPPAPTIYLSPESQTLPGNRYFSVQVRTDSGATAVNAVQANLSYPAALLDFVSISATGTAFPVEAQATGGNGQINIARGIIGSVSGDQLVATVNFRTKTGGGNASLSFTSGTSLVNASTNQNILASLAATGGASYTIDVTTPVVGVTTPAAGAVLAVGSTTNIAVTASDNTGTISQVEFYVDGILKSTDTSSPYSYSWPTTGLALGNHTIQARASDPSGNIGISSAITVALADLSAPVAVTNFRATGNTLNSISLAWNASTDNIGVTGYRISHNGQVIATTNSTTLAHTIAGLTGATQYTYAITAFDAAGNQSPVATITVSTKGFTPGDIDRNGKVDILDLSNLLSKWGTSDAASDINADGSVDVLDLSILLTNYGK